VELDALAQLELVDLLVGLTVHDSARLGAMRLPGIGFTRVVQRVEDPDGVRKPADVSPGSNQAAPG